MQKLWKSDKKEAKLWHFEISIFSENTSWPILMNIQMSELMSPSQFSIHFINRNDKNLISVMEYKTCLITTKSKWEIVFSLIHFDMGICFYSVWAKNENAIYNAIWKILTMTSSTRSFEYSPGLVKKCFPKKMWEISKCHIFLISHPIFIIFSLFYRKKFTQNWFNFGWISPGSQSPFAISHFGVSRCRNDPHVPQTFKHGHVLYRGNYSWYSIEERQKEQLL